MVSPFLFYLAASVILGCGQAEQPGNADTAGSLRDDLGVPVSTAPPPGRIISLAPSITETLFALGLDSSITGVTDFCDFPPEAHQKESVGGMASPSFERITSMNPDLILMTVAGNSRADYDKLVGLGFRVFVTNPSTVDGIFKSVKDIGVLTGKEAEADALVASMQRDQERWVQEAHQRPQKRVLMLLSLRPVIAVGKGTFLHELFERSNARNVAADAATAYPMLSREHLLELQPEVILVMSDVAKSLTDVQNAFPEWESLEAFRNGRVFILNANTISRPGPRIMSGLKQIVQSLK